MATERLYKVKVVGLDSEKVKVLDFLHLNGFMHISPIDEVQNDHNLQRDKSLDIMGQISEDLLELKWLKEVLENYSDLKTKTLYFDGRALKELQKDVKDIKKLIHTDVEENINRINSNDSTSRDLETRYNLLNHIPFEKDYTLDGDVIFSLIAKSSCSETYSSEKISSEIEDIKNCAEKLTIVAQSGYFIIQGTTEQKSDVERFLKENDYEILNLPEFSGTVKEELKRLEKELKLLSKETEASKNLLKSLGSKHLSKIRELYYNLNIYYDRYEVTASFLRTEETFFFEGYLPQRNYKDLLEYAKKVRIHVIFESTSESPTRFRNLPYVKHFEFVTKMFGYPKYATVDPTIFIAFFMPIFFGFMFSDIGYGIMLLLLSIFMLYKSNRRLKILKDAGVVLFVCSLSTILFGYLFGSFFGDLIMVTPLLFNPFDYAKNVLIAGLGLGLIHMNLGIGLSLYENIKNSRYKNILYDNFPVFLLQLGVLFIMIATTDNMRVSGGILLGLSVILLFIKSSIMGLMEITGFMGTWFSYARLLALCLATGGIALGINIMAQQLNSIDLLGPVLFIVLVIFGHIFNFALNLLGSSVHSVRLHYIEFFSQFYSAGGRPFVDYSTERVEDSF